MPFHLTLLKFCCFSNKSHRNCRIGLPKKRKLHNSWKRQVLRPAIKITILEGLNCEEVHSGNCCSCAGWYCQGQISDLKQALNPSSAQLQSMLLDPAVNLLFMQMKHEMDTCRSQLEQSQKDLAAWKFTPDRYHCLLPVTVNLRLCS